MARIKISKVAKDLNVALPTVVEFLRGKNIEVDDNPNARIEEDVVELLESSFKNDRDQKNKSQQLSTDRAREREKAKPAPAPREVEEVRLTSEINKPKILGKIELDAHGNPIRKQAPAPAPKPAPSAEVKPEPKPAVTSTPQPATQAAPKAAPAPQAEPKAVPAQETPAAKAETAPAPASAPKENAAPAAAPAPEAPKAAEEEIFTVGLPANGPTINVVGKIDLSAINQSTRPKRNRRRSVATSA